MKYQRNLLILFLVFLIGCVTQPPASTPVSITTPTVRVEPTAMPTQGITWIPHSDISDLIHYEYWTCNPQVRLREGNLYLAGNNEEVLIPNRFGPSIFVSGDYRIRITLLVRGSSSSVQRTGGIAIFLPGANFTSEPTPVLQAGLLDGQVGINLLDDQQGKLLSSLSEAQPLSNSNFKFDLEIIIQNKVLTLRMDNVDVLTKAIPVELINHEIAFGIFAGKQSEVWVSTFGVDTPEGRQDNIRVDKQSLKLTDLPTDLPLRCYAELRGKKIGVSFNDFMYTFQSDRETLEKAAREFDVVFPVGVFDMNVTQTNSPQEFREFEVIDPLVSSGGAFDFSVWGQPILFWQGSADWLCQGQFTRQQLLDILKNRIFTLVQHNKGQIPYWVVVNEPLDSEPRMMVDRCRGKYYKWDLWYEKVGPEYLDLAYQWAREADPNAELILNENAVDGVDGLNRFDHRSDEFYELVKSMVERGIPLDGVGLQMHLVNNYYVPTPASIAANMKRFTDLGLDIYITEMTVTIDHEPNKPLNSRLEQQAKIYRDVVTVCLQEPRCKLFMVFGLYDRDIDQRKPGAPPDGSTMFDDQFQPKPAYFAVRDALQNVPIP